MPYSLVFEYHDGGRDELKPLCCNNPESPYGEEDKGIERNAKNIAARINRSCDDGVAYVEHYEC